MVPDLSRVTLGAIFDPLERGERCCYDIKLLYYGILLLLLLLLLLLYFSFAGRHLRPPQARQAVQICCDIIHHDIILQYIDLTLQDVLLRRIMILFY